MKSQIKINNNNSSILKPIFSRGSKVILIFLVFLNFMNQLISPISSLSNSLNKMNIEETNQTTTSSSSIMTSSMNESLSNNYHRSNHLRPKQHHQLRNDEDRRKENRERTRQTRRSKQVGSSSGSSVVLTTSSQQTLIDPYRLAQLQMGYSNTPPSFPTHTRELFVDVSKDELGSELMIIKATDIEGDTLEYSLRPALHNDASPYFSINSTTGELSLAHKPIPFYPFNLTKSSNRKQNIEEEEQEGDRNDDKESGLESSSAFKNLYFLNVVAYDGFYPSTIEFKIYVWNSSHFIQSQSGTKMLPISVEEADRNTREMLEKIMRLKIKLFYDNLLNVMSNNSQQQQLQQQQHQSFNESFQTPTIVYPDFVNPGLSDPSSSVMGQQLEQTPQVSSRSGPTTTAPTSTTSQNLSGLTASNANNGGPINEKTNLNIVEQSGNVRSQIQSSSSDSIVSNQQQQLLLDGLGPVTNNNLGQTLIVSLVVCSSFIMILLVVIAFVYSMKQLKRRLKYVERQHEHLSQRTSIGSSVSSNPGSQANHSVLPSISQFTLASDPSSIGCTLSRNSHLATNYIIQPSHCQAFASLDNNLHQSMFVGNYRDESHQMQEQFINREAIANPLYLRYHHDDQQLYPNRGIDSYIQQQQHEKSNIINNNNNNNNNMNQISSRFEPRMNAHLFEGEESGLPQMRASENPYYPIEDDFYSTINPDHVSSSVLKQQENIRSKSPGSISSSSSIRNLASFLSLPNRHHKIGNVISRRGEEKEDPVRELAPIFLNNGEENKFNNNNNSNFINIIENEQKRIPINSTTIARTCRIDKEINRSWEVERHRLRFIDILDEGQFGQVWRCKLKLQQGNEETVAVKTLKSSASKDEKGRADLLAEIDIMKQVHQHPNVVKILHCCTKDAITSPFGRPILLVMEYLELGKLQSYLEKSQKSHCYTTTTTTYNQHQIDLIQPKNCNHLTSKDLIKFTYHVAKGMEYISSKSIVHRDLASRNILVSSDKICKIGDFGMARCVQSNGDVYERQSKNTKIPVRWMAPEVLLSNWFTTKSDVFSFGILMWEIVTLGSTPYRHLRADQVIEAVARQGQRPDKPEYCHLQLYQIMSKCWAHNSDDRPTFSELVKQLDEMLLSANDYIELDQYQDHHYCNLSKMAAPFELL